MISVIIPLYNKANDVQHTLSSVLNQSYADFEIVIVDDGSTDNSVEVVNQFNDGRIRLIKKENGGVSSARNRGIAESKYEYLVFVDADDLWAPNHLEEIIRLIAFDPEINFYATGFTRDKKKFGTAEKDTAIWVIENFYAEEATATSILSSSSFAFKKNLLLKLDYYYDEHLKYGEDVEFWYRILRNERLVHSDLITVLYNIEGENRSDNVLPIKYRFHTFVFQNKTEDEKKYLGKLAALVIIDYISFRAYRVSFRIFIKYIKQYKYISRYFYLLINKKLRSL